MIAVEPWYYDQDVYYNKGRNVQSKGSTFSRIEGGASDYQKVNQLYQKSPIVGYIVGRVEIIDNKALTQQFEGKVKVLEARANKIAFQPAWKNSNSPVRDRIHSHLLSITNPNISNNYPHVKFMPMFHGTKASSVDSILETGFANLATTDCGFFGKGIYNTSSSEYAHRVYSDGTIIYNWVTFFSAYPVLESDMGTIQGGSNFANYDAHYTLVVPKDPNKPNEVIYYPINQADQKASYDELVVFDSSHVLPRYIITLTADGTKLKPLTISATGSTLMTAISEYYANAPSSLKILLEKQLTNLTPHLGKPLNSSQLALLTLIERSKGEQDSKINTTLANRILQMLEGDAPKSAHTSSQQTKEIWTPVTFASAKQISPATTSIIIIPSMAFGPADWEKYFGKIGNFPPLPNNIHQILEGPCPYWSGKKVKDTHTLTLVPENVAGETYTLGILKDLIKKPKEGGYPTKFAFGSTLKKFKKVPSGPAHWVLTTKDVVPGTLGTCLQSEIQKVIEKVENYKLVTLLDGLTSIMMWYVKTGERLLSSPFIYSTCQEHWGDFAHSFGEFDAAGMRVRHGIYYKKKSNQGKNYGGIAIRRLA